VSYFPIQAEYILVCSIFAFDLQLLRGSSESELKNYRLTRDPDAYFYTQQGKSSKVNTINDGTDHRATNAAFKTLGFSNSEIDTVWSIVAAILHLVSTNVSHVY
jgi:myosin-1